MTRADAEASREVTRAREGDRVAEQDGIVGALGEMGPARVLEPTARQRRLCGVRHPDGTTCELPIGHSGPAHAGYRPDDAPWGPWSQMVHWTDDDAAEAVRRAGRRAADDEHARQGQRTRAAALVGALGVLGVVYVASIILHDPRLDMSGGVFTVWLLIILGAVAVLWIRGEEHV